MPVLLAACLLAGVVGLRSLRAQDGHAHRSEAPLQGDGFASALAAAMDKMHKDMAAERPTGNPDVDFLATMIPHHAGAILMCREASIRDARLADLCRRIIESQEREIREMKEMLGR